MVLRSNIVSDLEAAVERSKLAPASDRPPSACHQTSVYSAFSRVPLRAKGRCLTPVKAAAHLNQAPFAWASIWFGRRCCSEPPHHLPRLEESLLRYLLDSCDTPETSAAPQRIHIRVDQPKLAAGDDPLLTSDCTGFSKPAQAAITTIPPTRPHRTSSFSKSAVCVLGLTRMTVTDVGETVFTMTSISSGLVAPAREARWRLPANMPSAVSASPQA